MSAADSASTDPSPQRLAAWLALSLCNGIGPVLLRRLMDALHTPENILSASPAQLADVEGIGQSRAQAIARGREQINVDEILADCRQRHIGVICPDHAQWPPGLTRIPDPPTVLYIRGRILREDMLAMGIVGSRRCTLYGREQAGKFAAGLVGAGVTVVSGGARGIDTAAHTGALRAGGRTIVVQGCGLGHCYPQENAELYDRIVQEDRGAVISELPPDSPPLPENFPPRNRIITGMSLGILVVEANLRSGSLITARLAADDYAREVFAVPGRVDSIASSGTHHLIKTGAAALVESVDDILRGIGQSDLITPAGPEALAAAPKRRSARKVAASGAESNLYSPSGREHPDANTSPQTELTAPQKRIVACFTGESLDVDELCASAGLPPAVIMAELTFLEISGVLRRQPDRRYTLNAP
ncbi:MAG: DNA-processing protein DprA [Phycisphaerae bacterium]